MKNKVRSQPKWSLQQGWRFQRNALIKSYVFQNFEEAMMFMCKVSPVVTKLNHHPSWNNRGSKIRVSLTTHDTGGVTNRDFRLAKVMDRIASQLQSERGIE